MAKELTGYDLSRHWFNFSFEHKECKSQHTALYMWIIELNNRLGWKTEFGLPTADTMEGLSIGNKATYINALRDLKEWGFIEIIKESKNQYQACIIKLCRYKSEPAQVTALDKVPLLNRSGIGSGIGSGIVPIDKLINYQTKQTIKEILGFFGFSEINNFIQFQETTHFVECLEHRERLDYFLTRFEAYKKLKYKHGFVNFIGTPERYFEDGKWNAENWNEIIEKPKTPPIKYRNAKKELKDLAPTNYQDYNQYELDCKISGFVPVDLMEWRIAWNKIKENGK